MRLRRASIACTLLMASLGGGCKQQEGDRCQLDSDCEDSLVCCVDPSKASAGGTCQLPGKCGLTPADGGNDAKSDGKVDSKPAPDSKPTIDLGPGDSKPLDQSVPDKLPLDQPHPDKSTDLPHVDSAKSKG